MTHPPRSMLVLLVALAAALLAGDGRAQPARDGAAPAPSGASAVPAPKDIPPPRRAADTATTVPNNWILGQVSGVAVDKRGHVWIVHRPGSLSEREVGAAQTPPWSKCCWAAPPVLVFDESGNLVRAWGGKGQGYDWPEVEHGI